MAATNSDRVFHLPRKHFIIEVLLVAATVSIYWPVGNFGFFQFDDPIYITENPNARGGFTLKAVLWAFTTYHASNWHPLTWLSHMGYVAMYGLNPGAHHLTNIIFHSLNTFLLFIAFRKIYPNYAEAHNNLGVALLMQNRRDEAIRCFREALRIKPDYVSPQRNLHKVIPSGAGR